MELRWRAVETYWGRDNLRIESKTTWGEVAGCKIEAQCKGKVRAYSMSLLTIAAGKEVRLRVGFENKRRSRIMKWGDQQGPGMVAFSMVAIARRKKERRGEGPSLDITTMFFWKFTCVFLLSVWMKEVASEYSFYILTCMNLCLRDFIYFLVKNTSNVYLFLHTST